MQTWRRLRSLPASRIDDTLGFMIHESGEMGRLISAIETLKDDRSLESIDPQLMLALLRCLYLSAAIDGDDPTLLMETVDELLESQAAPFVRAEAAHRLQIAQLSRVAAERNWLDPLLPEEIERLTAFLACHGASPRAISSIKRLADHAIRLDRPRDLDACRDWVSASVNHHPFARAIDGSRQGLSAVGSIWTPSLQTVGGSTIDWAAYRGAPVAVAFAGAGQTPSNTVLAQLREASAESSPPSFRLVVVSVQLRHAVVAPKIQDDHSRDTVVLNRGWREPLLAEFGIRALPTIFILDGDGRLRRIVRPSDWRVGEIAIETLSHLSESTNGRNAESTSKPTNDDVPARSPETMKD